MPDRPPSTPAVAFVSHPSSLEHDTGGHPERPERILAIEAELERTGWSGLRRLPAPPAELSLLEAVHPPAHVERISALCRRGGGMIEADTIVSPGSWQAALHAAGGAAHMVDLLLGGGDGLTAAFSALRPPGHHAERAQAMGFCLFNNVAVAARRARDAHGCRRVLILDWDVHHGNGTSDVFWEDAGVLFVSIHQWPLYPGTGHPHEVGAGAGLGHTVNLPVPGGAGDQTFVGLVEQVVVPLALAYEPELVLVSAGFDAHSEDPLASCAVSEDGYSAMAAALRRTCAGLGDRPLGLVLEGGYALGALARSVRATLESLAAADPPAPSPVEPDPLVLKAAARVGRYWPALTSGGARR